MTRPSVRLSPPFRLLLSTPHAGITCNFAKRSEKCSVSVSKYSNAAIFKVQSLWGFPQMPASSPALLESAGHGDESVPGYSVLTAYPLHFTPSQNVSNSRVLLRAPRPTQAQHAHHAVTSKHSLSPALFLIGDIGTANSEFCHLNSYFSKVI